MLYFFQAKLHVEMLSDIENDDEFASKLMQEESVLLLPLSVSCHLHEHMISKVLLTLACPLSKDLVSLSSRTRKDRS